MPGVGASTPIIWGDHVFITSAKALESSLALAYDRKTGDLLWQKEFTGYGHDDLQGAVKLLFRAHLCPGSCRIQRR